MAYARRVPTLGPPAVLKTRRLGYDGKGQRIVAAQPKRRRAFGALRPRPCILESFVDFAFEASVSARAAATAVLPPTIRRGTSTRTISCAARPCPRRFRRDTCKEAVAIARAHRGGARLCRRARRRALRHERRRS